ncbi:MAG: SpoIID/LytB domain-containing protein [Myxococcota bacterium]|nr:SpoIID/LytB domain-containing protein [Myxococcota bacterium]
MFIFSFKWWLLLLLTMCACEGQPLGDRSVNRLGQAQMNGVHRLSGQVIHGIHLTPLADVTVSLVGTQYVSKTDAMGRYTLPHKEKFRWVELVKSGYEASLTSSGDVTRLWPQIISETDARNLLRARRGQPMDSDDLNDPDLTARARAILSAERHHRPPRPGIVTIPTLKQAFLPPETIRIYRRGPENNSCLGRVDVIPLEEYVKGVVPHEWIPSWHDESLRAGSIAARSYAWGWINEGGKYDCADLDDSTRSQVYEDETTVRASAATDSTRGVAVIRDGVVIRSEYSAENGDPTAFGVADPVCAGEALFGHGRGMCQWGSQRWASQRNRTAEWMVEHYYPGATTSGGAEPAFPRPRINLRQRLARIDDVECANPEATFNCADFLNQAWSVGLFDVFVGHAFEVVFEISNLGDRTADEIGFSVAYPNRYLRLIELDEPLSGWVQTGGLIKGSIDGLAPSETRSIRFQFAALKTSLPRGRPLEIKAWVNRIDALYEKSTWSEPPQLNDGQSFNDGDLRLLTEIDCVDPRSWNWSSGVAGMLEGWRIIDGSAQVEPNGLGLILTPANGVCRLDSLHLPIQSMAFNTIVSSATPERPITLQWRLDGEDFSEDKAVNLRDTVTRLNSAVVPNNAKQYRIMSRHPLMLNGLSLEWIAGETGGISDSALDNPDAWLGEFGQDRGFGPKPTLNEGDGGLRPSPSTRTNVVQLESSGGCSQNSDRRTNWTFALVLLIGLFGSFRKACLR